MSASSPQYVTNHCEQCGGGVEFDARQLTNQNRSIPCPHCGREIRLSIPEIGAGQTEMLSRKPPTAGRKFSFSKGQGMALTAEQAASPVGRELISHLQEMEED